MTGRLLFLLLPALALIACGQKPGDTDDLATLDRELANARDPAVASALSDPVMVDPALAQSANADAVRPPPRPDATALPPADIAPRPDPIDSRTLKSVPAATGTCPACRAAAGAMTLGALAERQDRRTGRCAATISYSATWANRLPADLPLYPDARVTEAAGSDTGGCALRIVSFASSATVRRVMDYYYTRATAAGYTAEHRAEGAMHVLGGTRGDAAYIVYASRGASGGTDIDLIANAGR